MPVRSFHQQAAEDVEINRADNNPPVLRIGDVPGASADSYPLSKRTPTKASKSSPRDRDTPGKYIDFCGRVERQIDEERSDNTCATVDLSSWDADYARSMQSGVKPLPIRLPDATESSGLSPAVGMENSRLKDLLDSYLEVMQNENRRTRQRKGGEAGSTGRVVGVDETEESLTALFHSTTMTWKRAVKRNRPGATASAEATLLPTPTGTFRHALAPAFSAACFASLGRRRHSFGMASEQSRESFGSSATTSIRQKARTRKHHGDSTDRQFEGEEEEEGEEASTEDEEEALDRRLDRYLARYQEPGWRPPAVVTGGLRNKRGSTSLIERNIKEIAVIQDIVKGKTDVLNRFENERVRSAQVRRQWLAKEETKTEKVKSESAKRGQRRGIKQSKVEDLGQFIMRICSWMVIGKLVESAQAIDSMMADEVKREEEKRLLWAQHVVARSFPPYFRKYLRRKRIRRFTAAAFALLFIVKMRQAHKIAAKQLIQRFLFQRESNPLLQVRLFVTRVRVATRVARNYFVIKLHQFRLLQLQWEAMENFLLLTDPHVAVPSHTLKELACVNAYTVTSNDPDGTVVSKEKYDALPVGMRSYAILPYSAFLGHWRRYVKAQELANEVPWSLQQHRTMPEIRDISLKEYFAKRNAKVMRTVTQVYYRYQSEKRSAKDMLEASKRLRYHNALQDVDVLYPQVKPGSRLHQILVQFEEEYTSSPFFHIMAANNRAVMATKMPDVPRVPLLVKEKELERMVRKGLEKSKLARVLKETGASEEQATASVLL